MNGEFRGPNTDAYLVDLDRIVQDVSDDVRKSESKQAYIKDLRQTIGKTAVYRNFGIALNVISGRLLGLDSDIAEGINEINDLYGGTAIHDGFLFGMAVNNKLLMGKGNHEKTSPLDILDPHVAEIMQTIGKTDISFRDISAYFKSYAEMLYESTLAHPNNPDAKQLVGGKDPIKRILLEICDGLYDDNSLASSNKELRFGYGYAIARAGMNGYNLQIIDQLDQLFQDPAATLDT